MYSIAYGTRSIEYDIERKASLKNSYINVTTEGVLVRTDDKTTQEEIDKMVYKKLSWVSKKLEQFKAIAVNHHISTGSRLYYMGKSYYVKLIEDISATTIMIEFNHSKFYITIPMVYTEQELQKAIENFYKQKATQKLIPLTKKWAKRMGLEPEHISFRYSKNRWGSCSATHRISYNYHLVKLSASLIEYVVVHELAHIVHKNHSKEFWKLVYHYIPDYKIREEKIRVFEKLI